MKCNTWILKKEIKRKRKNSKPCIQILKKISNHDVISGKAEIEEGMEQCGGKIIADLAISEYGSYEGESYSSELDVYFMCDSCDQTYFPQLPYDKGSLSEFLTEAIASLPEDWGQK